MAEPFVGLVAGRRDVKKRMLYGVVVPRAVLGFIIMLIGVLLTLGNMGILEIDSIWHFWPLSLVGIGLSKIFQPPGFHGRGVGLILLAAGIWIQLSYFGIVPFRARYFWPAMLIVLGGLMVWRGVTGARVPPPEKAAWVGIGPDAARLPAGETSRAREASASSPVNVVAVLGGVEHRNSSQDFQGGNVSAILGGCDVDLRKAAIAGDQAVLDVFAFWGGIEIKVPEEWTVNVKGIPVLGAFNDRTHPPREGASKTLVISGAAIMGGVEIKN